MPILTLMAAAAATAMQPGSVLEKDVRCVAAIALAGEKAKKDGEDQSGMMMLMMFYVGKIEGEAPGFDLAKGLSKVIEAPDYETQTMPADLIRCAGEMEQQGSKLESVAQALDPEGA
jgi:hypothetical protein